MLLQSVVLSRDTNMVGILMRALSRLDIEVVVCSEANSAIDLVQRQKFEAVVVDFRVPGGKELLQHIRQSEKKVLVAAILAGQAAATEAFASGANFVLYEPITLERAMNGLRAVKNLMYPQRRQHLRKPAYAPVYLRSPQNPEVKAVILNVSEGGMAVRLPAGATASHSVHLRFSLPGIRPPLDVNGEVVWVDKNSRAGIRFLRVPRDLQTHLKQWLFPALHENKTGR